MRPDPDEEDPLRTAEVAAVSIDDADAARAPIELGATNPPPKEGAAPRVATARKDPGGSDPAPATLRFDALPAPHDGWLAEDTSLTRATEKTLSVPAKVTPDRATLTVISGLHAGQVFALDQPEHVIGRGTEADLWFEDATISRKHARIARRADGRLFVEDLGSTNGTFVAGRRIEERVELTSGDRLQIGPNLLLRFAVTDDAEEELQRRLYESSTRDALTRAFNRKYFGERLIAEVAHARRHKTQLGLLMLDLDRFKDVNDTHGHLAGDMVLRVVASHLLRLIRVEDVLARFGGEEFVVLVRSTAHRDAGVLAERVRATIEKLQINVATGLLSITTSIGVASLAELPAEAGPTDLVARADARLYRAKLSGRNRVCVED